MGAGGNIRYSKTLLIISHDKYIELINVKTFHLVKRFKLSSSITSLQIWKNFLMIGESSGHISLINLRLNCFEIDPVQLSNSSIKEIGILGSNKFILSTGELLFYIELIFGGSALKFEIE